MSSLNGIGNLSDFTQVSTAIEVHYKKIEDMTLEDYDLTLKKTKKTFFRTDNGRNKKVIALSTELLSRADKEINDRIKLLEGDRDIANHFQSLKRGDAPYKQFKSKVKKIKASWKATKNDLKKSLLGPKDLALRVLKAMTASFEALSTKLTDTVSTIPRKVKDLKAERQTLKIQQELEMQSLVNIRYIDTSHLTESEIKEYASIQIERKVSRSELEQESKVAAEKVYSKDEYPCLDRLKKLYQVKRDLLSDCLSQSKVNPFVVSKLSSVPVVKDVLDKLREVFDLYETPEDVQRADTVRGLFVDLKRLCRPNGLMDQASLKTNLEMVHKIPFVKWIAKTVAEKSEKDLLKQINELNQGEMTPEIEQLIRVKREIIHHCKANLGKFVSMVMDLVQKEKDYSLFMEIGEEELFTLELLNNLFQSEESNEGVYLNQMRLEIVAKLQKMKKEKAILFDHNQFSAKVNFFDTRRTALLRFSDTSYDQNRMMDAFMTPIQRAILADQAVRYKPIKAFVEILQNTYSAWTLNKQNMQGAHESYLRKKADYLKKLNENRREIEGNFQREKRDFLKDIEINNKRLDGQLTDEERTKLNQNNKVLRKQLSLFDTSRSFEERNILLEENEETLRDLNGLQSNFDKKMMELNKLDKVLEANIKVLHANLNKYSNLYEELTDKFPYMFLQLGKIGVDPGHKAHFEHREEWSELTVEAMRKELETEALFISDEPHHVSAFVQEWYKNKALVILKQAIYFPLMHDACCAISDTYTELNKLGGISIELEDRLNTQINNLGVISEFIEEMSKTEYAPALKFCFERVFVDLELYYDGLKPLSSTAVLKEMLFLTIEKRANGIINELCRSGNSDPVESAVSASKKGVNQVSRVQNQDKRGYVKTGNKGENAACTMEGLVYRLSKAQGFDKHFVVTNLERVPQRANLLSTFSKEFPNAKGTTSRVQTWDEHGNLVSGYAREARSFQPEQEGIYLSDLINQGREDELPLDSLEDPILISISEGMGDAHANNVILSKEGVIMFFDNTRSYFSEIKERAHLENNVHFSYRSVFLDLNKTYLKTLSDTALNRLKDKIKRLKEENEKEKGEFDLIEKFRKGLEDEVQAINRLPPGWFDKEQAIADKIVKYELMEEALEKGKIKCYRDLILAAYPKMKLFASLTAIKDFNSLLVKHKWDYKKVAQNIEKHSLTHADKYPIETLVNACAEKEIDPQSILDLCKRDDLSFDEVLQQVFDLRKAPEIDEAGYYLEKIKMAYEECIRRKKGCDFKALLDCFSEIVGDKSKYDEEQFIKYLYFFFMNQLVEKCKSNGEDYTLESLIKEVSVQLQHFKRPKMDELKEILTRIENRLRYRENGKLIIKKITEQAVIGYQDNPREDCYELLTYKAFARCKESKASCSAEDLLEALSDYILDRDLTSLEVKEFIEQFTQSWMFKLVEQCRIKGEKYSLEGLIKEISGELELHGDEMPSKRQCKAMLVKVESRIHKVQNKLQRAVNKDVELDALKRIYAIELNIKSSDVSDEAILYYLYRINLKRLDKIQVPSVVVQNLTEVRKICEDSNLTYMVAVQGHKMYLYYKLQGRHYAAPLDYVTCTSGILLQRLNIPLQNRINELNRLRAVGVV